MNLINRRKLISMLGAGSLYSVVGQANSSSKLADKKHVNKKSAGQQKSQKKPNIFYICVDDLGTYLNCYGNTQVISPNFDAFAKDAMLFEHAHCQVAVCTASRTSILTGVRPETSGITSLNHDWKALLPDVVSLPEHLQRHGYKTISVGKIWDPRSGPGSQLGWDDKSYEWGIKDNKQVLQLLDKYEKSQDPCAFFIGYRAPHCPWKPAEKWLKMYEKTVLDLNGPGKHIRVPYLQKCSGVNKEFLTHEDALDITRRYYASVTEVDALIGVVIEKLKAKNLYDNSIIVLWSGDHGYHLGENDHWGKWTNYNASTQVPMIIRTPKMSQQKHLRGVRCDAMVECVDMYATLSDLAGVGLPQHALGGKSLKPLLSHPTQSWTPYAYSMWNDEESLDEKRSTSLAVKSEQYNYVRYKNGTRLLFDTQRDKKEQHNIASDHPKVVKEMDKALTQHYGETFLENLEPLKA